jgi:hypothetical protein
MPLITFQKCSDTLQDTQSLTLCVMVMFIDRNTIVSNCQLAYALKSENCIRRNFQENFELYVNKRKGGARQTVHYTFATHCINVLGTSSGVSPYTSNNVYYSPEPRDVRQGAQNTSYWTIFGASRRSRHHTDAV